MGRGSAGCVAPAAAYPNQHLTPIMSPKATNGCTAPVIVSCHFSEDLEWLQSWEGKVVVVDKDGAVPTTIHYAPLLTVPNECNEASAYVAYICHSYMELPDHIAFIHGHETSWHQRHDRDLLSVIRAANPSCNFVHLNNLYRQITFPGYVASYMSPGGCKMVAAIGAQFVVSKKCILQYPLGAWVKLLMALCMPCTRRESFDRGVCMEVLWPYVFDGPPQFRPQPEWFPFHHCPEWIESNALESLSRVSAMGGVGDTAGAMRYLISTSGIVAAAFYRACSAT